jgi:hypothetical protein
MKKNLKWTQVKSPPAAEPAYESEVSREERKLLSKTDHPETDESKDIQKLTLDSTGNEDRVNEKSNPLDMGADLDIPGSELDDTDEAIGGEDEENNSYSLPD